MELKTEIKEAKYVSWKDKKLSQNNEGNRKPPYRGSNRKPVNKKNLEYFNCDKKGYFKSECWAKLKDQIRDWTNYRNVRFLETEQPEIKTSSDSEIKEINLHYQRVWIPNQKYNAA